MQVKRLSLWNIPFLLGKKSTKVARNGRWIKQLITSSHRPRDLSILQRDIHLIEIKYCEDTRPHSQLSAAQEQH